MFSFLVAVCLSPKLYVVALWVSKVEFFGLSQELNFSLKVYAKLIGANIKTNPMPSV